MSAIDNTRIDSLARQILHDFDTRNPGTAFGDGLRLDIEQAWRVQDAVARLREQRGETVIGYKIGCVCEHNQQMMGLTHPASGRLWSTELQDSGAVLRKTDYANPAIEAEFAITINRPIGIDAGAQAVADAVEAVFPVLELHNLVLRGEPPHGHELIANNAIHAGVVRGEGIAKPANTLTTDLALVYDGETVDSWDTIRWPQDILSAIQWLANRLAASGRSLQAGDMILTGALGPPIPVADKSRVDVSSSAFGNVCATFV